MKSSLPLLSLFAVLLGAACTPRLASDDPSRRAEGLTDKTDPAALHIVACTDSDASVRAKAARMLKEPEAIADAASETNDPVLAGKLLARLDQERLASVALGARLPAVRDDAFRRITDPLALARVCASDATWTWRSDLLKRPYPEAGYVCIARDCEDDSLKIDALSHIKDPANLVSLARCNGHPAFIAALAQRLSDQTVLKGLMADRAWVVRAAVARRITDDDFLTEQYRNEKDVRVRLAIADAIRDDKAKARLYSTEERWCAKFHLIGTMEDSRCLAALVLDESDKDLSVVAAGRIRDSDAAKEVALGKIPAEEAKLAAVGRITDEKDLLEIVRHTDAPNLRTTAARRLKTDAGLAPLLDPALPAEIRADAAGRISNQALLLKTLSSDPDLRVRMMSLLQLQPCPEIEALAVSDAPAGLRLAAVTRIRNPGILRRVLARSIESDLRFAACLALQEQEAFTELAISDLSSKVAYIAMERVTDRNLLFRIAMRSRHNNIQDEAARRCSAP